MTIEEAIKKSGTTNLLAEGSTKKAQQLIQEDEEVLYAINTNVAIKDNKKTIIKNAKNDMFSLKNALNGVVVITDKRVLFCSSILGNINIKQILIKDILSIDENINGLTKMGQFRIQGVTETFVINILKNKIVDDLRSSIYKSQSLQDETRVVNINQQTSSNADEILKYKKLLEEGIITEEEFQKKKEQLLNI